MILVEETFVKLRNILKSYMKNVNMLFNSKLPTDLYTTFQIIKLLIKKGNLNLVHNKITYQHYIYQISSSQALHTSQNLYTQETSFMKWKTNTAKQWK